MSRASPLPPSGDRSKAVMVMVIARLLLGFESRTNGRLPSGVSSMPVRRPHAASNISTTGGGQLAAVSRRSSTGESSWNARPRPSSWTLQEPQIERREHQDDSDVHHQPLPEPVPEEQDVHPAHDGYQREHVKHDGCLSAHSSFLLLRPRASGV